MTKENKNDAFRDHSVFPDVVSRDGEVLSEADVAFAYTREGRRTVGLEYPNPVPLEPPIGYVQQEPLHVQIRRMVATELSARAAAEGFETEEEANDFLVDEEDEPFSPWEDVFEPLNPWPPRPEVAAAEEAATQARVAEQPSPDAPPSKAPAEPADK